MASSEKESMANHQEEIADEFGMFQTMSERDFLTKHLLKKKQEKAEKENAEKTEKANRGEDEEEAEDTNV